MGIAELLKKFGGVIAWLSGSLAGVSALLYAIGFLATKSADQALGLGFDFAARDPVFYIARGGSMIMTIAILSVVPAVVVIVMGELLRRAGRRLAARAPATVQRVSGWAEILAAPVSSLAMVALVLVGLAYSVTPATNADGMLFAAIDVEFCARDRESLDQRFVLFAIIIGLVAGVGVIARASLLDAGQWLWSCLAGLALFLALVGTPIAYGALAVTPDAPRVWITPLEEDQGRMWLLSRAEDGAVIWLEEQRKVRWIRADQINTLTFGPSATIASVMCVPVNTPP